MQFTECFIGVSPDGGNGVFESWLFCLAGMMFSLGVLWKYWAKLARSL